MKQIKDKIKERDPTGLKRLQSPHTDDLYNLLATIPILLIVALIFFTVSFLTTQRETKMSDYLEKASKWNDDNIAEKISNIRLMARIMPSQNTEKNALIMEWVSMTTETEYKDAASS